MGILIQFYKNKHRKSMIKWSSKCSSSRHFSVNIENKFQSIKITFSQQLCFESSAHLSYYPIERAIKIIFTFLYKGRGLFISDHVHGKEFEKSY